MSPFKLQLLLLCLLAVCVGGCASWTDRTTDKTEAELPQLVEHDRSMVLKVQFAPVDLELADPGQVESIWEWTDETILENETRQRWLENGLRIGRVIEAKRLRAHLESLTGKRNVLDQFLSEAEIASEVSHGQKRIPMRLGKRYELPVHQPIHGDETLLVRLNGELLGKTLTDPQFMFAVTPTNGSVSRQIQLRIRPEVQHGAMQQRWISSDKALRIDRRRETWSIKELDLDLPAREGDTFVITGTESEVGIGGKMLRGKSADNKDQQVVVIVEVARIPSVSSKL